ncbi:unnamed protein product [Ostreobium quekettii]|uniref:Secreted protein n=1 Tax=Ostreobium quekettii TaxID=121088 RepID=A0A8S1J129_9CHLO|nr:unnamed protein product [Ostreobium quekettii]
MTGVLIVSLFAVEFLQAPVWTLPTRHWWLVLLLYNNSSEGLARRSFGKGLTRVAAGECAIGELHRSPLFCVLQESDTVCWDVEEIVRGFERCTFRPIFDVTHNECPVQTLL